MRNETDSKSKSSVNSGFYYRHVVRKDYFIVFFDLSDSVS